eukprot:TRINITY_DN11151_c0_g1_i2.p1 TRINITY_DN11151_c0_g1~~TRINITY_DN11151_c0_g1_i2.p1  ORF type:complete len:1784 (-),score=477.31 TRINITY_DN11151_c0_g1_i2:958-5901(-)
MPEPDITNKEINRPPIAPIKIRLRTSSETASNTGRSLSSILAEIVKEPCSQAPSAIKDFSEFEIPRSECQTEEGFLFSSSLSKSFSALARFAETEICRDILNDVVIKVEGSRIVSSDIIHEILDDIFFNEACCANILDNIVDTVVKNVETKKELVENERKADIMAQRKFMEQQKLKAHELQNKNEKYQAVDSVNMQRLHDNVKGINNVDKEIVELPLEVQITETSEEEPDIVEVFVSDDESSIELSDSEFDMDGENPSIIDELKIDNPEGPEQTVISNVNADNTPVSTAIASDIADEALREHINENERSTSDEKTDFPSVLEFANEEITEDKELQSLETEDKELNSSETRDHHVMKAPVSQEKEKANLSKKLKKRKIPKLLIKPIKKDEETSIQENVAKECSKLLSEMVTTTVKKVESEVQEPKMPPIIVKIPKLSISPKKSSKKDIVKSPTKNCIKKLNFTFGKQPTVSIKNLKILPPVPPEVTEAILELANADEVVPDSRNKEDKKPSASKASPLKPFSSKLKLQTPPPLCVIRNKKKAKSPEIAPVATVDQQEEGKESIVTVLKMSEIVSMKQKEENSDRLNDLEKMLELENKLKIEDRRRMKEEKEQTVISKKKPGKVSSKKSTKEAKLTKESKIAVKTPEGKETEIAGMDTFKNDTKIDVPKNNVTDGPKLVILAKKSPPKPKLKKNGVRPFTPVSKKAPGTPDPQPEIENKTEQAAQVGLQRRNSIPKHKEQWVVSDRIKTPSPTPPSGPTPFVAKKSRPDETVSFSIPAGGFNSGSVIPSKPKPLLMQVDELFSQYFPEVKEDMKTFNGTPASESIDNANEKQLTFVQKNTLAEAILEELLLRVVKISMQAKLVDCPPETHQKQKETKALVIKPEGKSQTRRSRSREISPDSPIRSRNVSADSSRSGFSFNSNESLEDYKEEYAESEKDLSNRRKKRKSDNLGLNGGYWDVIGVRGVIREKIEKQESIEKEEKTIVRTEKRSKRKETSRRISKKENDIIAELGQDIQNPTIESVNNSKDQTKEDCKDSQTVNNFVSNTRKENITFVEAIINDIILSLKTIEDTKSPPKQTSIKRSPPSESKPSKRQKIQVTETQDTEQYEIADVFPEMDYTRATQSNSMKPGGGEIETKQEESKTDKLSSEKRKEKLSEAEGKKKIPDSKSIKPEKVKSTKMGKRSPEPLKRKESILKMDKKECSEKTGNLKQDIYEFEDDDVPVAKTNQQTNLVKDVEENRKIKNNPREEVPIVEEIQDEMDLNDVLVGKNKETLESNNDIWSSINETLKDLKESTNNKQITKPCKVEKSSLTKEKFQPMEDCKDSLLDDLNSSQNSELDGWPYNGDILKDEITGDNADIWASTNEIMRSISESLSDVKAVKPTTSNSTLRDKKETKSSQDITSFRKSRQKRKDSEENIGNPDSGKENADIENVDLVKSESKKSERVLSPVTKRRKIVNRKYINDDFDDSHSPNRQKEMKVIQDFEKDNQPKRRRSTSSSSGGSENEAKKLLADFSEKSSKQIKSPLYKPSLGRKTIQLIDPSPIDPEIMKESMKSKTAKSKSLRESSPLERRKGEKPKSDFATKAKASDTKETKRSSNSSISKPKSIWSSKTSTKLKTKPSTDLVNFLDKEYEKAKNEGDLKKKLPKK